MTNKRIESELRDPEARDSRISLKLLHLLQGPRARDQYAHARAPVEREKLTYVEDEFKILNLGEAGAEILHDHLETQRGYALTSDIKLTDEYYELQGKASAVRELGDWPRIRRKVGQKLNPNTGEFEPIDEFEFTLKGMERRPGNRTERGYAVFKVSDYGTGERAITAAHQAAVAAMRAFVSKNFQKINVDDLTLWNVWNKRRISHEGDFVKDENEEVYGSVTVDTDYQKSKTIVFLEDTIISNEDRLQLLGLYEQAGETPPQELLHAGNVKIKKGYILTMPLAAVATYAEFEVVYPQVNENDPPEEKAKKERLGSELRQRRNALYESLRTEGIIDPALGAIRGNLSDVLAHHNVPDIGTKKSSRLAIKERQEAHSVHGH